jgi:WD40 repeat protein
MTDIASLELSGHSSQITHALFDSTGNYAITIDKSNTICIWNSKTGALLQRIVQETSSIDDIGITKNGQILYTISRDNLVRIWHLGEEFNAIPKTICHSDDKHIYMINVSFSSDGRYMLTAGSDRTAKLWDLNDYSCKATLVGHTGGIYLTAFNNAGTQVATASNDTTVRIWQLDGLKVLAEILYPDTACALKFDKCKPILTMIAKFGFVKTCDLRLQKSEQPSLYCLIKPDSQFDKYLDEYRSEDSITFLHPNNDFTRVCAYNGECQIWDPFNDSFAPIAEARIFFDNPFNKHGDRMIVMKKSDLTKAKILTDISHKKAINTLALALHPRLGAESPASLLPQGLFSKIHKKLLAYSFIKEPTRPQQEIKDSVSENRR